MSNVKRVYTFGNKEAEGNGKMRELLGGKGANLAEMNLIGIPVPPGFTITTEACTQYYEDGRKWVQSFVVSKRISRKVKVGSQGIIIKYNSSNNKWIDNKLVFLSM